MTYGNKLRRVLLTYSVNGSSAVLISSMLLLVSANGSHRQG
jgi:hypothetical protein